MRVVIAGGGSAGHVNPALALAHALAATETGVSFVGTTVGVEAALVPAAGYELDAIEVEGFDRARPLSILTTGARAAGAVAAARSILKRRSPAVVVGMGGYVSLPVCLAARTLGIPVVLHEQNIVFGLAHRVSKPFADKIAVSWEETLASAGPRGVMVGNPVMPELASFDRDTERKRGMERFDLDPERKTVLVFGGSLGAKRVNDAAVGLATMWGSRRDVQIVHITGKAAHPAIRARVEEAMGGGGALIYRVVDYLERMLEAYGVADIALCRGGASTVAELAVVGLPSVMVPYPYHRDRQQERHARVFERARAAVVLDDARTTAASVAALLGPLLEDSRTRSRMGAAAASLGHPAAASRLADVVREAGSP